MEPKPKPRENRLRSDSANRIGHLLAHRFEERVEAPRLRRLRLVAGFLLRRVASFRVAHDVGLRCGGLSVAAALNAGGAWTNARPRQQQQDDVVARADQRRKGTSPPSRRASSAAAPRFTR